MLLLAGAGWAAPTNDACGTAVVIGAVPFTDTRSVTGATAAGDDPTFECHDDSFGGEPSVWYRYTAPAAVSLAIDTFGSDFDTVLAVHAGACGAYTGPLSCNDNDYDTINFGDQSRLVVTLAAGQTVFIEVLDHSAVGGTLVLDVAESPVFQVSQLTEPGSRQAVAPAGDGGFLVVWDEQFPHAVVARRYDASGAATGARLQVNTSSAYYGLPAVAGGGSGFLVVWRSESDTRGRLVDASGVPLGSELIIAPRDGYYPAVTADALGNFLVSWVDSDGSGYGVFARRYDSLGNPQGGPFAVNTYTTGDQNRPSVTADGAGNFIVVWQSQAASSNDPSQDGTGAGVFGRRFDSTGLPLGSEFLVNSYTTGYQTYPVVSAGPSGDFVVVWADSGDRNCFLCVDARRFTSTGAAAGPAVRVEPDTDGLAEGRPESVAVGADGGFVIVWARAGYSVFARRFDSAGTPDGTEFQVTHLQDIYQYHPVVAARPGGAFVVAWDWSPYGSHYDVMGRTLPGTATADCPPAPLDASACHQPTIARRSRLTLNDRAPRSRSMLFFTAMIFLPLALFLRGLQRLQVVIKAIEPLFPQPPVFLEPVVGFLESPRVDAAWAHLRIASARDQTGAFQHL